MAKNQKITPNPDGTDEQQRAFYSEWTATQLIDRLIAAKKDAEKAWALRNEALDRVSGLECKLTNKTVYIQSLVHVLRESMTK